MRQTVFLSDIFIKRVVKATGRQRGHSSVERHQSHTAECVCRGQGESLLKGFQGRGRFHALWLMSSSLRFDVRLSLPPGSRGERGGVLKEPY